MNITLEPIGKVRCSRKEAIDDNWEQELTEIELAPHIPTEAFTGITEFSHLEIIFYFDKADESNLVFSGHPRGNPQFPITGIFAQRKKDRPNRLGLATVELISYNNRTITVKYLDAIDGTPVLDIKPVMQEFEPKGMIRQPEWATTLMKNYWS